MCKLDAIKEAMKEIHISLQEIKQKQAQIESSESLTSNNSNENLTCIQEGSAPDKPEINKKDEEIPQPTVSETALVDSLASRTLSEISLTSQTYQSNPAADLEKLNNGMTLQEFRDERKAELLELNKKISMLEDKICSLEDVVNKVDWEMNELQQYTRMNCVVLHEVHKSASAVNAWEYDGAPDITNFAIDILNNCLGMTIKGFDVDIAHSLRESKNGNVPIIIKFVQRSLKMWCITEEEIFLCGT